MAPTAQAKAYTIAVAEAWENHWRGLRLPIPEPLTGRLRVLILVHPHQEGIDIANREKAVCDALTNCHCWVDDKYIDAIGILRARILRPTGALDVIVSTIKDTQQRTLFETEEKF